MNHHRRLLRFTGAIASALLCISAANAFSHMQQRAVANEVTVSESVGTSLATTPGVAPQQFPTLIIPVATPSRTPTPINIGNFVWDDLDRDGRQNAGEPGLSGVTVQLWNSTKTALLGSTITSSNGSYTLIAPTPGNYRVRVVPTTGGDFFSPKDAIAEDTLDSDINVSGPDAGFTDSISIASNVISIISIDAGIIIYRTPTASRTPTPISIGNFVWYDINSNGIQDAGEPGLSSITVQLWNENKTQLIASAVTTNGAYSLVAPIPGNYRVRVLPPTGASFSPKDQGGNDQTDSDSNSTGVNYGFTDAFTIAPNVISTTIYDTGLINVPATPTPSLTPIVTSTSTATDTPAVTPTSTATQILLATQTPVATLDGTSEAFSDDNVYLPVVLN